MSLIVGAGRALPQSIAPSATPSASLADIRQEAKALKRQARQSATTPAPLFALPGLAQVLSGLLGGLYSWLFPPAPAPAPPATTGPKGATNFTLSSYNVLGSSHTTGGRGGYASGVARIREAAKMLEQKSVEVVGFQELNNDQAIAFKQAAGDTYGLYPGATKSFLGSHNSIAWRKDTWDLVKAEIVNFPSHLGRQQPSPVVLLRNKHTGQEAYFINVHNAPGFHKGGAQQQWRDKAVSMQVALINKLKRETGLPVIVTGDMNEKDRVFRRMHGEADMHAANEGTNHQMPRQMSIDWIFGSEGVRFKGFRRDTSVVRRKLTDHGMLVSEVSLKGRA